MQKNKELLSDYTRARHEFGKILIEAALLELLKRKRYFKKCQECGELTMLVPHG